MEVVIKERSLGWRSSWIHFHMVVKNVHICIYFMHYFSGVVT